MRPMDVHFSYITQPAVTPTGANADAAAPERSSSTTTWSDRHRHESQPLRRQQLLLVAHTEAGCQQPTALATHGRPRTGCDTKCAFFFPLAAPSEGGQHRSGGQRAGPKLRPLQNSSRVHRGPSCCTADVKLSHLKTQRNSSGSSERLARGPTPNGAGDFCPPPPPPPPPTFFFLSSVSEADGGEEGASLSPVSYEAA